MNEELSFLRAIFCQPEDDTVRLIYADWLEDRGDSRAEYLRLEVEKHQNCSEHHQAELMKRIRELAPKLDGRWVGWVWQARNLLPEGRMDLAFVDDGKGLIEVRGKDSEIVLLVEGKPIALNWDDCQGSVGQYLVFTGHTRGNDYARDLAEFVKGKVDKDCPLSEQILPLLALFVSGNYYLRYTPSTVAESIATLEYSNGSNADRELVEYYPADDRYLVCTQRRESLDEDQISLYRRQIRAGQRPIVLTTSAEGAWCEFVIDGHHKLAAYNQEQVRPTVLVIVRLQAPGISLEEGLGYLPSGHPGIGEYRRVKGYAVR